MNTGAAFSIWIGLDPLKHAPSSQKTIEAREVRRYLGTKIVPEGR